MAATTIIVPITNITNNQINQAWINIALGISLIIMSYLYFNYLFGIISLIALTLIMYFQIKKGSILVDDIDKDEYSIFISLILIIFGIIFLIYGSDLFVNSAIILAKKLQVSEAAIGLSLIGNILGSNIYNVLGVLGISSFFGNFGMPEILATQDLYFMLLITFVILIFMFIFKKLGRLYGSVGLMLYLGYIYYIFI